MSESRLSPAAGPLDSRGPDRAPWAGERDVAQKTMNDPCPSADQLWPAAVGEAVSADVAAHLERCGECRRRTRRLALELVEARRLFADRRGNLGCDDGDDSSIVLEQPAETPTDIRSVDVLESDVIREPAPRPFAAIGKYVVFDTICHSGQAVVLRGLHPSLLIDVVIKLAHRPWRQNASGRARLVSEARALAEIVHPHLARLYDLDFFDDQPYLVLEYVRGRHLRHHCESAELTPAEIAFLMAKVARAVAAAHDRGILHLDLKPENILVTPTGEPVLIDFGLSFLSCSDEGRTTEGRCLAGTPQYMAPEQMRGLRDALTRRTDIFGLGGVLYFLCVGQDPFTVSKRGGKFERSSEPDWRALARANVPARLKTICRKAMTARPAGRYATAEQLARTLEDAGRSCSTPASIRKRRLAGVMFLMGLVCLLIACVSPSKEAPDSLSLTLHVSRAGAAVSLPEAMPLQAGDHIRMEGFLSESSHVALFAFPCPQQPHWLTPLDWSPSPWRTHLAYPGFSGSVAMGADLRNVLVLLVGRRRAPVRREDIAGLLDEAAWVDSVSDSVCLSFNRHQCEIRTKSGVPPSDAQRAILLRRVHRLQCALAARFDHFSGVLAVASDE
ncbi:MAG: serine/threonine protein kinase [Planctomycetaceae bacterium]|nr:serine/threonine protein kinase [Planctomycetaceae bacterium]